ncbi:zeta-crystallin-like isoform X2 [Ruditapes philippinarum]|uniref:zeta-crystallin-like isoform X2 n=1 Tax=Ruditapes philippinarum TaxID=129788 RepID=UPI00295BCF48|nr:zeta-crystallin-like isoform X2 [Ruditapes philippinarum]
MAGRQMMRAVRVAQFGGPEVLKVETNVAIPTPSQSQVLVEVKAAGINPVDTYIRSGTYAIKPPLPFTPGSDLAGIVKDVGANVTKFKPGDRVYVIKNVSGGYAEFTTVEENMVGHLTSSLSFQQGAGVGIACYTAFRAVCLIGREKVKPGNSILIHGASGAVGLACVQIAVSKGMKVYGTAGTLEGIDLVLKQGATAVFNHREEGYADKIVEATGGVGPDLIIEMLANVNLETDMKIINRKGIIVVVGNRGSIEINPRLAMQKESHVTGMILMNASPEDWVEMHSGISEGLKAGWLVPHICKEYKLDEAPVAHDEVINNTGTLGKRVFVL